MNNSHKYPTLNSVFSFCFLLWGLSAVASSVNLLVLKFMTISLEEEEQGEDELHEMGANVVTLEEEVVERHLLLISFP